MRITDIPISEITVGTRMRPLDRTKVDELRRSIELHRGLLQPVIVTESRRLVAGHHRLEAARQLGWTSIHAVHVADDDVLVRLAECDENLVRNDLSVLEQGEHLLHREELLRELGLRAASGDNRFTRGSPETVSPLRTADLAAELGLSARTTQQRTQIAREIPEYVRNAIRGTDVADKTRLLLDLARARRKDDLPELLPALISGQARSLLEARGLRRRDERLRLARRLGDQGAGTTPQGPFGVLAVDPPWLYEARGDDPAHRLSSPYPSMTLDQIKALPVSDLADEHAVLWLWSTNGHIFQADEIIAAWGFQIRSVVTWVKTTQPVIGHWFQSRTEHVVLATKGSPPWNRSAASNIIQAPRQPHSRKPDEFYRLVDATCPDPRRVELFAREVREGWVGWGLEAQVRTSGVAK